MVLSLNQIEESICEIWSQSLNIDEVGLDQNFFSLGGTSLMMAMIGYEISQKHNVDIHPDELMQCLTVTDLARKVNFMLGEEV